MATVPTMRTWVAGELVTAAYMNSNIRDLGNFMLALPLANLRQVTAQSIPSNSWTSVLFDTEDIDRDNGHSTSTNTSRYVGKTPGYYLLPWTMQFSPNGTGGRWGRVRLNNVESLPTITGRTGIAPNGAANETAYCGVGFLYMNGTTDYVELSVNQGSGGALNSFVNPADGSCPRLAALWVSS